MNDDDDVPDGDWLNSLSEGARKLVDAIDLRRHWVGLERVQRIHLGLDDERMTFTSETIAQMIEDVAEKCDEDEAFTLRAVINALRGEDKNHILVLKQKKRGRFVSPDEFQEANFRRSMWLAWLASLENRGIKTESAISEIATDEGVSRATVFSEIRLAEEWLRQGKAMFPDSPHFENPRPDKSKKG